MLPNTIEERKSAI